MGSEIFSNLFSSFWSVLLIIIFFGGSIFFHELGHFLAALWRGLKIERFSIGFPPKIIAFEHRGIEYVIGATPLGGFVQLPQLADMQGIEGESQHNAEELPPISFTDKIIVSSAGAFFNVLFALALASILWVVGIPVYESNMTTQIGYVQEKIQVSENEAVEGPAFKAGIKAGDIVQKVDGEEVNDWEGVWFAIARGSGRTDDYKPFATLTVKRGEEILEFPVKPVLKGADEMRDIGINAAQALVITEIQKNSPILKAGIELGDEIIAINGKNYHSMKEVIDLVRENKEKPLQIKLKRGKETIEKTVTPQLVEVNSKGEKQYRLGFGSKGKQTIVYRNPFYQIAKHYKTTIQTLKALLNKDSDIGLNKMSGPPGIAYAIHKLSFDIRHVISLIVLININLAILNLLPIPVLDGGHMLFAVIGKLRGKTLPVRFIQTTQGAFMIMLLGLMCYVMFHDALRIGRDIKEDHAHKKMIEEQQKTMIEVEFEEIKSDKKAPPPTNQQANTPGPNEKSPD